MPHKTSIFLVTYEDLPELTDDDQLLLAAIEAQDCKATPVCWDDPRVSWREADVTVVRSTWDYIFNSGKFTEWVKSVSAQTVLVNTKQLLLWNMHKRYLIDLQNRGISIIPTLMVDQWTDAHRALGKAVAEFGEQLVIKPAVSCGSHLTQLFRVSEPAGAMDAAKHLASVLTQTDALIQPLISEVFGEGERSLVFFDGRYSHTVPKEPFREGITPTYAKEALTPTQTEILFSKDVLNKLPSTPMYARVDILVRASQPLLNELELIEPELHFRLAPGSATKLSSLLIQKGRRGKGT